MKIAVIMSSYNGEKYISEQIDSLLSQNDVDMDLYIRDDGSSDNTLKIIQDYADKHSNIHIDSGANVGFRKSFITELLSVQDYDYYAFSDQDDFWEPTKLSNACTCLGISATPSVYYSNLNISDEKLNIISKTNLEKRKKSLESLVMRRSIAGCTMVINCAMWDVLSKINITDEMLCRGHDSFIVTLCYSINGNVICDSNSYIRYRQHSSNTSGGSPNIYKRIKKEFNNLRNKKGTEPAIAQSIIDNCADFLSDKTKKKLEIISGSKNKLKCRAIIFFSPKFTTGNLILTVYGKIKAILGLL